MKNIPHLMLYLVCALLAAMATHAQAQKLYKTVGADGRVTYSDQAPIEGTVQKTLQFDNLPVSSLSSASTSYLEQLRKLRTSAPAPMAADAVVLFTADWCGYCKKAKVHMANRRVAFREVDIGSPEGLAAYAQAGGSRGVPLLVAGGQRVQGYSAEAYDAVFPPRK